jgi:hypothetical protein
LPQYTAMIGHEQVNLAHSSGRKVIPFGWEDRFASAPPPASITPTSLALVTLDRQHIGMEIAYVPSSLRLQRIFAGSFLNVVVPLTLSAFTLHTVHLSTRRQALRPSGSLSSVYGAKWWVQVKSVLESRGSRPTPTGQRPSTVDLHYDKAEVSTESFGRGSSPLGGILRTGILSDSLDHDLLDGLFDDDKYSITAPPPPPTSSFRLNTTRTTKSNGQNSNKKDQNNSVEFPPPIGRVDRLTWAATFWSTALPIVASYYSLINRLRL